ncbi:MAG: DUF6933 domain-containing protein [Burkholderiales bacterium]
MATLRCTQKLLTTMKAKPSAPALPSDNLLGDWSLNLLHLRRSKLVLAVSQHDRLGFVLPAAPFATLPHRLVVSLFEHLTMLGIPPAVARRECDAMQPLTITTTTAYPDRLSIQANLKDYAWLVEYMLDDGLSLVEINRRLSTYISKATGYDHPIKRVQQRLI